MIGTLVGQYRVVGIVGSGRLGTVYIGEHTLIKRRAAIKVLKPELSRRREFIQRFFNEARAAAAVKHAGIVQIFDFGFAEDGSAYVVMELLDGKSLAATLRARGPLPLFTALDVVRQVADVIDGAHAAGILHRDLEPDNIFLVPDPAAIGEVGVKVLDFGAAKLAAAVEASQTEAGGHLESPLYMAPEQFDGKAEPRSDVYALGCVLFEALIGTPPFTEGSPDQLVRSHTSLEPPRPSLRDPSLPPEVDAIVLRCLEKDPAHRFPSMAALAKAIRAILARLASLLPQEYASESTRPRTTAAPPTPPDSPPPDPPVARGASMPAPSSPGMGSRGLESRGLESPGMGSPPVSSPRGGTLVPTATPKAMTSWGSVPPPAELVSEWPSPWVRDPDDDDQLARVIEQAIPPRFHEALPYLVEFFAGLFATAEQREYGVVQLGTPTVADLAAREHYVLFLDQIENTLATPLAELSTTVFLDRLAPLVRWMVERKTPPGSVLIAILGAGQLGQGAREAIFALRRERNLFVVPIAASEIRRACEAGNARVLLFHRIADLHTISDPFTVSEGFIDPTRCIGFAAEVTDLVRYITTGGKVVSVAGPPGSGKTSVVAMAEYGCGTSNVLRRFVHLQSRELASFDPETLVRALRDRILRLDDAAGAPPVRPSDPPPEPPDPPDIRAKIMQLGTWLATSPTGAESPQAPPTAGLARRPRLVIVIEDADWLIRQASSLEPDAARRERAHELWRGLAQLCSSGGHTVIVTSVRDFQVMDGVPLDQPVSVAHVTMQALNRHESDRLVTSLGELVGFSPTRRALAALHRESGGNVFALRLLCSQVIRSARERPDYAPLARLVVTPSLVDAAARHIAATGPTFRPHVSVWLDDVEKVVLQHVARVRPRSPRSIRRALEGSVEPAQVVRALDGLELMGLVESWRGRHRVRIPLFERWINTHLDAPPRQRDAIKQARISRIAIGCTVTALLFGAYWTWLRSTRSTVAGQASGCSFELDYPDRIGSEETFDLFVYQECTAAAKHDLALEPVLSSLSIPAAGPDCAPTTASCTAHWRPQAGNQAHDIYQVRLRVDGAAVVTASIQKDRFASLRTIGEKTVPAIAFIPLLLSLVVAFHKDLKRYVALLWSRGGGAPAEPPPGEAPKS